MPNKEEVLTRLTHSERNLETAMQHYIRIQTHKWESLTKHRALLTPQVRIEKEMQRQDTLEARLEERFKAEYEKRKSVLGTELAKLQALDPMRVLLRGYARTTDKTGHTVDSVNCVNIEDEIRVAVADGVIAAKVTAVERKERGNDG